MRRGVFPLTSISGKAFLEYLLNINSNAHMLAVSLPDSVIPAICFLSHSHFSTRFGDCMYS